MLVALIALLLCAPTQGQQLLDLRQGTLSYVVVHKFHEVRGTTKQVEVSNANLSAVFISCFWKFFVRQEPTFSTALGVRPTRRKISGKICR